MSFKDSIDELSYGVTRIQPLLIQDDISRVATNVLAAQKGNNQMESVMETKLLDFNLDKSCYIVIGNEKSKKKLNMELKENPLLLCGQTMKNVHMEKYLGDMICSGGLALSVQATVMKRKGQTISSILETKSVIEDCRANVLGGVTAGIDIWELAILPFLLNNCETWTEILPKTMDTLESIQNLFLRNLLATPRSCPKPSLLWETGGLLMEHRIAKKKLMFFKHLTSLPESSLASEITVTQEALGYPGLVMECKGLIDRYNLPDIKSLTKLQWKKLVNNSVQEENKNDLLEKIKSYKKLEHNVLSSEKFEAKEYLKTLNLPDARLRFATRSKMTKSVQMNFKGDPKCARNLWKCQDCLTPDTQEHILRCPSYLHLRTNKDMKKDKDLVDYFRKVISIREKTDDQKTEKQ